MTRSGSPAQVVTAVVVAVAPVLVGEGAWLQDATRKLGEIGREFFGIKSTSAKFGTCGTPVRKAPFAGKEITVNKPYTKTDGVKAFVPTGFGYDPVWSR